MATTARDALAAQYFPDLWAKVATRPGASRQRQQLRQRAEHAQQMEQLRAAGASCASCRSYRTDSAPGFPDGFGPWCEIESDFHGTTRATPDGLCRKYHAKAPAPPSGV